VDNVKKQTRNNIEVDYIENIVHKITFSIKDLKKKLYFASSWL